VALPETISARYSEEDAEYLTVRPVRRQTFRFDELVDMILSVTGKDPGRVQKILRTGTVVFHFYRYWWTGFEVDPAEHAEVLARYPDADSARLFHGEDCTAILLEGPGQPPRQTIELDRASAARHRLLHRRSAWDALIDFARAQSPEYSGYSYQRRADVYRLGPQPEQSNALLAEAGELAPRGLRAKLGRLEQLARIVYICPRSR
jgi:hypothetical protein